VVSPHREIHFPFIFWRPMPIQYIFSLCIPIPVYTSPQCIHLLSQALFTFIAIFEILSRSNQSLYQKGGFDQVSTIVILTEWLYSAIGHPPVGPCAMELIRFSEPICESG